MCTARLFGDLVTSRERRGEIFSYPCDAAYCMKKECSKRDQPAPAESANLNSIAQKQQTQASHRLASNIQKNGG